MGLIVLVIFAIVAKKIYNWLMLRLYKPTFAGKVLRFAYGE